MTSTMKPTPDRPEWRARAARMRQMTAELAEFATHFNLERESCTCGESHRWKDMNQWQLNERFLGVIERINNLADIVERRAHEFVPEPEKDLPGHRPTVSSRMESELRRMKGHV